MAPTFPSCLPLPTKWSSSAQPCPREHLSISRWRLLPASPASFKPPWRKPLPPSSRWMVRRKGRLWQSGRTQPNWRPSLIPACAPDRHWLGDLVSVWATGIECATAPQLWLNLGGQPVAIDSAQPVSQMAGMCEIAFRIPANVSGDAVSLTIETLRSDSTISGSNQASVAVRGSSPETNADNLNLEEKP